MIPTKAEFIRLSRLGVLGNTVPVWDVEDVAANAYTGQLALRSYRKDAPFKWPNFSVSELPRVLGEIQEIGYRVSDFYLHPIDDLYKGGRTRRMNAELYRDETGLAMLWAEGAKHLRAALEESGQVATGLAARYVLEKFCDPASIDDFHVLFEKYDTAACVHQVGGTLTLEISAFDGPIGTLKDSGRNTIVWECRSY
jgi:hypothetical protein